eukprot:190741-Prymnesium_polylepis.1
MPDCAVGLAHRARRLKPRRTRRRHAWHLERCRWRAQGEVEVAHELDELVHAEPRGGAAVEALHKLGGDAFVDSDAECGERNAQLRPVERAAAAVVAAKGMLHVRQRRLGARSAQQRHT